MRIFPYGQRVREIATEEEGTIVGTFYHGKMYVPSYVVEFDNFIIVRTPSRHKDITNGYYALVASQWLEPVY